MTNSIRSLQNIRVRLQHVYSGQHVEWFKNFSTEKWNFYVHIFLKPEVCSHATKRKQKQGKKICNFVQLFVTALFSIRVGCFLSSSRKIHVGIFMTEKINIGYTYRNRKWVYELIFIEKTHVHCIYRTDDSLLYCFHSFALIPSHIHENYFSPTSCALFRCSCIEIRRS